jgi:hypothetical protein
VPVQLALIAALLFLQTSLQMFWVTLAVRLCDRYTAIAEAAGY